MAALPLRYEFLTAERCRSGGAALRRMGAKRAGFCLSRLISMRDRPAEAAGSVGVTAQIVRRLG